MAVCYILYSQSLDSFYTGCTHDELQSRFGKHLSQFYGANKYTAKTKDWELYLSIDCSSFLQAMRIEKHIKRMKSKKYIHNLKLYTEMVKKLLDTYSD